MIYQLKDISARTIIRHDISVKIISAHIHLLPVNKLEQNGLFVVHHIGLAAILCLSRPSKLAIFYIYLLL
jgi:hypothetical protein